jgi:hypothetical protein
MRAGSQIASPPLLTFPHMSATIDNVILFPLHRRLEMHGCPHCGQRDDVWQIGKLLWAYCETHQLRWVAADYVGASRATINRREMREGLEFLATFIEVCS